MRFLNTWRTVGLVLPLLGMRPEAMPLVRRQCSPDRRLPFAHTCTPIAGGAWAHAVSRGQQWESTDGQQWESTE
jgi:hypothetical protein